MTTKKSLSYQSLTDELDSLMSNLQSGDLDIEAAMKAYERGLVIISELEKQLKLAENKVKKINPNFKS